VEERGGREGDFPYFRNPKYANEGMGLAEVGKVRPAGHIREYIMRPVGTVVKTVVNIKILFFKLETVSVCIVKFNVHV